MGKNLASDERWKLLKALYREAAALSADDRFAFLRRAVEGNEPLTAEVERLLEANERSVEDLLDPARARSLKSEVELDEELTRLIRCVELLRQIRLGRLRARMEDAKEG